MINRYLTNVTTGKQYVARRGRWCDFRGAGTEGTCLDEGAGSMSNRACQRWPAQRYFFHRMHLQSAMYCARATASCCAPPTLHVSILEPILDPSSTVRARAWIMSKCEFIIAMTAYNYLSWLSVVQLVSFSFSLYWQIKIAPVYYKTRKMRKKKKKNQIRTIYKDYWRAKLLNSTPEIDICNYSFWRMILLSVSEISVSFYNNSTVRQEYLSRSKRRHKRRDVDTYLPTTPEG